MRSMAGPETSTERTRIGNFCGQCQEQGKIQRAVINQVYLLFDQRMPHTKQGNRETQNRGRETIGNAD